MYIRTAKDFVERVQYRVLEFDVSGHDEDIYRYRVDQWLFENGKEKFSTVLYRFEMEKAMAG